MEFPGTIVACGSIQISANTSSDSYCQPSHCHSTLGRSRARFRRGYNSSDSEFRPAKRCPGDGSKRHSSLFRPFGYSPIEERGNGTSSRDSFFTSTKGFDAELVGILFSNSIRRIQ